MSSISPFYPEQAYPELYDDVMYHQLFADSKTFADATARISPEEIGMLYGGINRKDKDEVLAFVQRWFDLPVIPESDPIASRPIEEHLHAIWDTLLRPQDKTIPYSTLIPLPNTYIVPGGRFRECYYWDSYFTMLGLRESGRIDIIRDMIRNFAWLIDQFGHIPNGNRSYFLSRSQPPFFSLMIEMLAQVDGPEVYIQFLPQLLKEYSFWTNGISEHESAHRRIIPIGSHFLNRYYDDLDAPRTESYAEDVRLHASTERHEHLYRHIRSACESGWDFSSRWFASGHELKSICTTDIIPIDLNVLLYLLEVTIARAYALSNKIDEQAVYEELAARRLKLVNQYLWNNDKGYFSDYRLTKNQFGLPTLAMMFPLFAKMANEQQANQTIAFLKDHFLKPGGWVTTLETTGQQWDAPNGWAPLQWITFIGLRHYGAEALAKEGATRWLDLNRNVFNRTGRMMEKYNVEDLTLEAGGGEYPVQDGFGWTNGVFLALIRLLHQSTN